MGSTAGPLMKDGKKTRLKLSLEAWGHFGDKASAVAKDVENTRRLSEHESKEKENKERINAIKCH